MDPVTILILVGGALAAAAAVTLACWHQMLAWAEDSLLPWLNKHDPRLADLARQALVALDKVTVAAHQAIKQAWRALRQTLLRELIHFRKESSSTWLKTVTSWVIERLESGETVPVKIETTERLSWVQLPPDIREASLRWQRNEREVDFTKLRDQEILAMSN